MSVITKLYFYFIEVVKQKLRTIKAILKYPSIQISPGVVIGASCRFGKDVKIYNNSVIANTVVDDYSYIGVNSEIKNCAIGKYCSIAPNVKVGLGIHPVDKISTYPGFYSKYASGVIKFTVDTSIVEQRSIEIGNDVWIGANSLILDGVKVGDGAVIAAGSVVTKNVAPYSIVGGVPAKLIRMRFNEDEVSLLETFKWWDRDYEFLKKNAPLFLDPDEFFNKLKSGQLDN